MPMINAVIKAAQLWKLSKRQMYKRTYDDELIYEYENIKFHLRYINSPTHTHTMRMIRNLERDVYAVMTT